MNEIIKIAISKKVLNSNSERLFSLLRKENITDKITEILNIEVSKLFVGLMKLER